MVLVFDLDDTLYPEIEFVKSGFWEVAKSINADQQLEVYLDLIKIFEVHGSGRIFNQYSELRGANLDIQALVSLYRNHTPKINLPLESHITLATAKRRYATALITDGPLKTQQQKYKVLGLGAYIQFPVFTHALGTFKPNIQAYRPVIDHFGAEQQYVYIADNPAKDFCCPREMGWMTIRYRHAEGIYRHLDNNADFEIRYLPELFPLVANYERRSKKE